MTEHRIVAAPTLGEIKIDGMPPLQEIEGLEALYSAYYADLALKSTLLSPKTAGGSVFVSPAALADLEKVAGQTAQEVHDLWGGWLYYRRAQVLNRPPEMKPTDQHRERLAVALARLGRKIRECEKMKELVDRQLAEKEAIENPPLKRRGSCWLRNGAIWKCDGRLVINGEDRDTAYFQDTGQSLNDYLAEVAAEQAATRERLREQKRQAYHEAKNAAQVD